MSEALLQILWLAGIFGLRKDTRPKELKAKLWASLRDIEAELGHPPYPMTASWYGLGKAKTKS